MDGDGTRGRKRELRRHYKEVRSALGEDGRARRDAAIAGRVKRLPEYLAADTVLMYLSVGDEVDTSALAIVPGLSFDERGYRRATAAASTTSSSRTLRASPSASAASRR